VNDGSAGTVCVGFANTQVGDRDELGSPVALEEWLSAWVREADGLPSDTGVGCVDDSVLLRLRDFRAFRDAVGDAIAATIERRAIPNDAIDALNSASAMAPTWPVLVIGGKASAVVASETSVMSETTRILGSIARSAIELLGGPDAARLRRCPACARFFLSNRTGQVWCSAACGNRTRVARHRSRRAASAVTR
jgi:predicted RNA-binding Zn ribbon-like protein